ncbi:MAG TPA: hypothetical protein VMV56_00465 [Williamwhitmania sp.]|nr:hypothetical protein [Williamwhitmania sp.]
MFNTTAIGRYRGMVARTKKDTGILPHVANNGKRVNGNATLQRERVVTVIDN